MYVLRADHLVLDSQLVYPSLGRNFPYSQHSLPVVLCFRSRPHCLSPSTLARLLRSSSSAPVWAAMLMRLLNSYETQSQRKFPVGSRWLLQIFLPPSSIVIPKSQGQECFVDVFTGTEPHTLAFRLAVVFSSGLHLFQRKVSMMKDRDNTYLRV